MYQNINGMDRIEFFFRFFFSPANWYCNPVQSHNITKKNIWKKISIFYFLFYLGHPIKRRIVRILNNIYLFIIIRFPVNIVPRNLLVLKQLFLDNFPIFFYRCPPPLNWLQATRLHRTTGYLPKPPYFIYLCPFYKYILI